MDVKARAKEWLDREVKHPENTTLALAQFLESIRAEARAEAAERAEMALALMFDMGQITRDKAVSMMRAAILADEVERKLKEAER